MPSPGQDHDSSESPTRRTGIFSKIIAVEGRAGLSILLFSVVTFLVTGITILFVLIQRFDQQNKLLIQSNKVAAVLEETTFRVFKLRDNVTQIRLNLRDLPDSPAKTQLATIVDETDTITRDLLTLTTRFRYDIRSQFVPALQFIRTTIADLTEQLTTVQFAHAQVPVVPAPAANQPQGPPAANQPQKFTQDDAKLYI